MPKKCRNPNDIPRFDGAPGNKQPGFSQQQIPIADQWSARQRLQPSRAPRNLGRFAASLVGYGFYGLLIMGAGLLGLIILSALFSAI